MRQQKKPVRLPKSVETIRDVLALDDVNAVCAWLDQNKHNLTGLILVAATKDGTLNIKSAGVHTASAVYLLEAGKMIMLDEDIWGHDET